MMKVRILWAMSFAMTLVGCSKEMDDKTPQDRRIEFNAKITDKYIGDPAKSVSGRAASYIETDTFATGDQIGVLGFSLPAGDWSGTETPTLMYNAELTKVAQETFRYSPMSVWPVMGKTSFFAYYPYSESVTQGILTPSPITRPGYPTITLVLGKSDEPIDFMTAQREKIDYASTTNGAINFTFEHRLSKIRFQSKFLSENPNIRLYINTIRIRNVYNKAVYTFMDPSSQAKRWSDYGNESTVDAVSGATLKLTSSPHVVGKDYTDILLPSKSEAYALMIPQKYENTELEIGYMIENLDVAGGSEYYVFGTKTLPISVNWEMGEVYTYRFEFVFADVLGVNIKVSVVNSINDWVGSDVTTGMGD